MSETTAVDRTARAWGNTPAVLERARDLIRERGWIASNPNQPIPFGPDTGPLTLSQAIWQGACQGEHVDPLAVGAAAKALCRMIGGNPEVRFMALSAWARRDGRTQQDVEALLGVTATAVREGAAMVVARLEAALAEDGGGDE